MLGHDLSESMELVMKHRFCILAAALVCVFSPGAVQSQVPAPAYDWTKLAGTWAMTAKVVISTCSTDYVGKISSNTWSIKYEDSLVRVTSDSLATFVGLTPEKSGNSYRLLLLLSPISKEVVYDLNMKNDTTFVGRRIYTIRDDDLDRCVALSEVELKKTSSSVYSSTSIRDIDWKNRKYTSGSYDDGFPVTLVNGEYEQYSIDVTYGDLNADGADEAIVLWFWDATDSGGNGYGTPGADVYSMVGGKPVLLSSIEGGSKGDGGMINDILVKDGKVIVSRTVWQDGDPTCCPTLSTVEEWSLKSGKIVKTKTIKSSPIKN